MKKNKLYYISLLRKKLLNLRLVIVLLLGLSKSSVRCSTLSSSTPTLSTTYDSTRDQHRQNLQSSKKDEEKITQTPLSSIKPLLIDTKEAKEYFRNNVPSHKNFCDEMKKRYNASAGEALAAWDYFYTVEAIEYERLKRERQKYQYILFQLLPHLKKLAYKESNDNRESGIGYYDATNSDCSESEVHVSENKILGQQIAEILLSLCRAKTRKKS